MRYDSPTARGAHNQDSLGQQLLRVISNVGFAFFVLAVLTFTVIAVTYQPPDPLDQRAKDLSVILSGVQNTTFKSDDTLINTGEEFNPEHRTANAITQDEVNDLAEQERAGEGQGPCPTTVDCSNAGVLAAIEGYNLLMFPDLDFLKYRHPVPVPDEADKCDVAWKYRSKHDGSSRMYRDYRRFTLIVRPNCAYQVVSAGKWHSGIQAKPKFLFARPPPAPLDEPVEEGSPAFETDNPAGEGGNPGEGSGSPPAVEQVIEIGVDTVAVTDVSSGPADYSFANKKYLLYDRGGDYCKNMNHFTWSFLCALGEARYLDRTFVMDMNICLPGSVNPGHENQVKDFRLYFDLDRLKNSTPIVDQNTFWKDWNEWNQEHPDNKLQLREVLDFHITPMDLKEDYTSLLFRKFPLEEPDNYWYRVCEGPTEGVIERPWGMLWKSKRIMDIVESICGRMEWNFDGLHVIRGDKAKNYELYPHLDEDTQPERILDKLRYALQVQEGRTIYIATNEVNRNHFDILREHYKIYTIDDFQEFWSEDSEWYKSTKKVLESRGEGQEPEFDGYMRVMVDSEVFYRAQKKFETFNDLTADCKNGVNTC